MSATAVPVIAAPANHCAKLLTGKINIETSSFIGYLGELWRQQLIGEPQVARLLKSIDTEGKLTNPITEEDIANNSALHTHRDGIDEHLRKAHEINLNDIRRWTLRILETRAVTQTQRQAIRTETNNIYTKIVFYPIPGGNFLMGYGNGRVEVELTHSIEVMSTKVTQKQWAQMMGKNPSWHVNGEHTTVLSIENKPIKMQPDNPVETVTWWSAIVFANRLSEEHGLNPAYDLRFIEWKKGTSAHDGSLDAISGAVLINAPEGDIYRAEGFRLPTEAEQEYLLRGGGVSKDAYYFGDGNSSLKEHAWYSDNANERTHPVGERKPLIIAANGFHDIRGNVAEWSNDWYWNNELKGGKNPPGPTRGLCRACRGGSWASDADSLGSSHREGHAPGAPSDEIGLRLVRTIQ